MNLKDLGLVKSVKRYRKKKPLKTYLYICEGENSLRLAKLQTAEKTVANMKKGGKSMVT